MIPLQTSFDALVSPEFLTQELSMLLVGLFVIMIYTALRLRSLFGIFGWMLMIVALMLSLFTNLQLIWFWLTVIAESFILTLAAIAYTRAAARQ